MIGMQLRDPWQRSGAFIRRVGAELLLGCLLTAGVSCRTHPPTQLVIRIDSDLAPVTEISCFGVRAERVGLTPGEQTIHDASYCLRDGGVILPTELGVLPYDSSDDRRVQIVVTANPGEADAFNQTAVVSFRRDHIAYLEMFLAKECRVANVRSACKDSQTCDRGGKCIEIQRLALQDLPRDAGLDAAKAATDTDAHSDVIGADAVSGDVTDGNGPLTALPRTGWVATASSTLPWNEPPANALDGANDTKW